MAALLNEVGGEPNSWPRFKHGPRFAYTGQIRLPEVSLYHYKARAYDPIEGRFLQTDPVGGEDDLNLYAYVGGDPVNKSDPTGTERVNCTIFLPATKNDSPSIRCVAFDDGDFLTTTVNAKVYDAAGGYQGQATQRYAGRLTADEGIVALTRTLFPEHFRDDGRGSDRASNPSTEASIYTGRRGRNGDDNQRNGRPGNNQAQNKQVNDAANQVGLTQEQRRRLGREVESESRDYGANLSYQDILQRARDIKNGN